MSEHADEHAVPAPLEPEVLGVDAPGAGASELDGLLGGLGMGGGAGGFDLGGLLDMAGQMQQQLAEAQEQAASTLLEGVAGGGVVKISVTGNGEFRSVTISPEVVDPDDVELLADLVLAALNDAMGQVHELQAGTFGDPSGAAGLGDLGGLLGGLG